MASQLKENRDGQQENDLSLVRRHRVGRREVLGRDVPDGVVGAVHRAPGDYPSGKQGNVLTIEFTVADIPCLGLNEGPAFKHTEAFSFQIATGNQAETDRLWNAIVKKTAASKAPAAGARDERGLSWQITPRALMAAIADPGPAAAKPAFESMMAAHPLPTGA